MHDDMTLYLALLMAIGSLFGVLVVARRLWGGATNPRIGYHMGRRVRQLFNGTARTTVHTSGEAEAIGRVTVRSFQDGRRYRNGSSSKRGRDA